jgi:topoisomerase IA-like protein
VFKNIYFLYYFNKWKIKIYFLEKFKTNGCYVNNGKYGYFLTCEKRNYKIPDWFPAESMTLEIAERLIEYKNKMSEQWLEKTESVKVKSEKVTKETDEDEEESTEEESRKMVFTKAKK